MKVTSSAAASPDGVIAGPDGEIDWLDHAHLPEEDFGYGAFIETVDALIMGRSTWEFVADVRPWHYGSRPVRVFSHRPVDPRELPVKRVTGDPGQVVRALGEEGNRHVWVVGGGGLARGLLDSGDLTDLILTVIPVTLGAGAPLLGGAHPPNPWRSVSTRSWANGVVQHHLKPLRESA